MLPLFKDLAQLENREITMNSYLAQKTARNLNQLAASLDTLYGADMVLMGPLLLQILEWEEAQTGLHREKLPDAEAKFEWNVEAEEFKPAPAKPAKAKKAKQPKEPKATKVKVAKVKAPKPQKAKTPKPAAAPAPTPTRRAPPRSARRASPRGTRACATAPRTRRAPRAARAAARPPHTR